LLPNDGVGLARMEFIVAEHIRVHPMALVHPEKIDDAAVRDEIARLTHSFAKPADDFVRQLSEGVGTIAAAFYPRPVIVRMSDFKTNEYASLLGGRWFEPQEANPMIGFRGASRHSHPAYAEGFALECAAKKRVRQEMGLVNVKLMIPFCRRVEEGERVLAAMATHGLQRGVDGAADAGEKRPSRRGDRERRRQGRRLVAQLRAQFCVRRRQGCGRQRRRMTASPAEGDRPQLARVRPPNKDVRRCGYEGFAGRRLGGRGGDGRADASNTMSTLAATPAAPTRRA